MSKAFISAIAFALLTSVSTFGHAAAKAEAVDASPGVVIETGVVNLNTADVETLTRELAGIGASKAKAIIEYRNAHGPFVSVDELLEVKGIGASTLEKNRSKLSLN